MVCSHSPTLRHLYTILYNPFLSISVSGSVNTPLWPIHTTQDTGTEGGTGNGTGSIGNNGSWSLFLSWTSVNISASFQNPLVSLPCPVLFPVLAPYSVNILDLSVSISSQLKHIPLATIRIIFVKPKDIGTSGE